jgi:hypothetical protein
MLCNFHLLLPLKYDVEVENIDTISFHKHILGAYYEDGFLVC